MGALRNADAEAYVLGAILLDNGAMGEVRDLVSVDDFTTDFHRQTFRALERLVQQGPTDETQLAIALGLTENSHKAAVFTLTDAVPTAANARGYALQVATAARLRRLHELCHDVADEAQKARLATEDEATAFFAEVQERFVLASTFGTSALLTSRDVFKRVFETAVERSKLKGRLPGIPTGIEALDALTLGMHERHLWIVGAKPGVGKTTCALTFARAVARAGKRGYVVSHEMAPEELGLRMLSSESKVPSMKIETGTYDESDFARMAGAMPALDQLPIVWDDKPPATIAKLRARCQALKRKGGLDVVYVDYLQLMSGESTTQNREREIGEISRGLKRIAYDLKVTVIALSQLNRKSDRHEEPSLSELRDSGSIEQDANVVIFLWADDDETQEIHGKVAKNRGGKVGPFELLFKRSIQRFEERP